MSGRRALGGLRTGGVGNALHFPHDFAFNERKVSSCMYCRRKAVLLLPYAWPGRTDENGSSLVHLICLLTREVPLDHDHKLCIGLRPFQFT